MYSKNALISQTRFTEDILATPVRDLFQSEVIRIVGEVQLQSARPTDHGPSLVLVYDKWHWLFYCLLQLSCSDSPPGRSRT